MPRPRNPRREALGLLAGIKRTASAIASRWNVGQTIFVSLPSETVMAPRYGGRPVSDSNPLVPTTYSRSETRKRRPEEYPENSAQEWKILWAYADSMEESAATLKAMALAKWQAIEGTDHTLKRVR